MMYDAWWYFSAEHDDEPGAAEPSSAIEEAEQDRRDGQQLGGNNHVTVADSSVTTGNGLQSGEPEDQSDDETRFRPVLSSEQRAKPHRNHLKNAIHRGCRGLQSLPTTLNACPRYYYYHHHRHAANASPSPSHPAEAALSQSRQAAWMDICLMHGWGMVSIALMLTPSIFNPRMLCCNALPHWNGSAWPVLNSSILTLALSWVWCCMLVHAFGLHKLALCTSMHSVTRVMLAYANLGVACPLPPIFMPRAVASGLGICLGLFLALCVAQVHAASAFFDTSDFYMNHAWAQWVVMLGMRHTLFRASAWMYKSAALANHPRGGGGETKED
jgi:hypothetical protein